MNQAQTVPPPTKERNFARVDCIVQFGIRPLTSVEKGPIEAQMLHGATSIQSFQGSDSTDDSDMELFNIINSKLDRILGLLESKTVSKTNSSISSFLNLPSVKLNLSANGIALISTTPFRPKQIVEVKLGINLANPKYFLIHGEIVRNSRDPKGWFVAINFLNISNAIQEIIANLVFDLQRELLINIKSPK